MESIQRKHHSRHSMTLSERIMARVEVVGECWLWRGYTLSTGYGQITYKGRKVLLHRAMYEVANGPIPPGLDVCHSCDNPPCVRPEHLWLGTAKDNVRDCIEKGRWLNGEANPQAVMTEDNVREIRARMAGGQRLYEIARGMGLRASSVRNVYYGRSWKHVA
jgi:hypothetical protein